MRPLKIGLTGTYGSGKSAVADMLAQCGAAVIDADRLAREAVEPGRPALARIAEEFGPDYILPDGGLDRKRMAETVFSSPERRRALETIVHPYVIDEMERTVREIERREEEEGTAAPMIVLNVPLLLERDLTEGLDKIVVVTVSESQRFERLRRRDGVEPSEVMRRLAAQWPQEKKAERADVVIDNSGSLDETRRQVQDLYARWVGERGGS